MKTDSPQAMERGNGRTIWVFTPSRTDPKDLEYILVQRQPLLQDAVERVRESALTANKHHQLFVGPRGCGKTHLTTLIVSRLSDDEELTDRLRIAWLNEDETCTTLLELLVKVHGALEKRYPLEFKEDMLGPAFDLKPDAALEFVSRHLLSQLGARTLLLVTENLDAIFEGLGEAGQKQFRSFIQENPKLTIVATAQRLVEDLSGRNSPFFGFFQTEHLKPLTVEQATELLQNIARLQEKDEVVEFLATSRGRSRVRAIHHLSGGNHRIYIVLSQFITRDSIDALLGPFMKMVDELTPYYQERIRWLPPLQRKIVEYLCTCEGTVPVKEIARRLFTSPPTISSQLLNLREKGYVESNQRGRESLYEISEPLMRICVEVKDNQRHQPLRLLVDFLRVWYDDEQLKNHLGRMEPASLSCVYLESAIERNIVEGNLRTKLMLEEIGFVIPASIKGEDFANLTAHVSEGLLLTAQLLKDGDESGAISCLNEAIELGDNDLKQAEMVLQRGLLLSKTGRWEDAVKDFGTVIGMRGASVKQVAQALLNRGVMLGQNGENEQAVEDYTSVTKHPGASVEQVAQALLNRGLLLGQAGKYEQAVKDYTSVAKHPGASVEQAIQALLNRGQIYLLKDDMNQALADFTSVINSQGALAEQVAISHMSRGGIFNKKGENKKAVDDYSAIINQAGVPDELVLLARLSRGLIYRENKKLGIQLAIDDFTAVITFLGAPNYVVELALMVRALTYNAADNKQAAIKDYSAVIGRANVPINLVATALYSRGVVLFHEGRKLQSQSDFETLLRLEGVPSEKLSDAHLALSELHLSEGRWNEGFRALEASLECGSRAQPVYQGNAKDMIGVIFSASLNADSRREKVNQTLQLYTKYQALPVLGEAVVQHIGGVFRAGEPFPSADNLESWVSAWEQAAESVPDFRLSFRLLKTAVEFVKAGGKDRAVLLDLASAERSIVEQALGLGEEGVTEDV
ncbi:tetratricopeptide repeat protein [Prosthecobacter sp. SYSU 5D2]|uniref:tetratricopeptide repeat protein n=1 Tax=Prosthecobacter sp. SYSU 5D2 TaxID=3134134 RepID=UPI0031FEAFE4